MSVPWPVPPLTVPKVSTISCEPGPVMLAVPVVPFPGARRRRSRCTSPPSLTSKVPAPPAPTYTGVWSVAIHCDPSPVTVIVPVDPEPAAILITPEAPISLPPFWITSEPALLFPCARVSWLVAPTRLLITAVPPLLISAERVGTLPVFQLLGVVQSPTPGLLQLASCAEAAGIPTPCPPKPATQHITSSAASI